MLLEDFNYELPSQLIAEKPCFPRDHSKLMVVDRKTGHFIHSHFYDLDRFLNPGDLLIINVTKVIRARIFGEDSLKRSFEIFLLKPLPGPTTHWECLVRPGRKIKNKLELRLPRGILATLSLHSKGTFEIFFPDLSHSAFYGWLEDCGHVPLPPYIKRNDTNKDTADYQTIYAKHDGSVAAPTAGLHFTNELFQKIRHKGISIAEITLHVGYGTFSPIHTLHIEDHSLHQETYEIAEPTEKLLYKTRKAGRRIIAVGTTSLRTLESIPLHGLRGNTNLFICPGFKFQHVDGLITNFHLPKSSLYILVSAFLELDCTRLCYQEAILQKYRFYSYGDAMVII